MFFEGWVVSHPIVIYVKSNIYLINLILIIIKLMVVITLISYINKIMFNIITKLIY